MKYMTKEDYTMDVCFSHKSSIYTSTEVWVTRAVTHCVGDVIDHDGSLRSSVVHRGQAVIPFLPCSVPDLKLNCCVIQADGLCEEGSWMGVETNHRLSFRLYFYFILKSSNALHIEKRCTFDSACAFPHSGVKLSICTGQVFCFLP